MNADGGHCAKLAAFAIPGTIATRHAIAIAHSRRTMRRPSMDDFDTRRHPTAKLFVLHWRQAGDVQAFVPMAMAERCTIEATVSSPIPTAHR